VTRRELAGAVAIAAAQLRDVHKLRPRDRVLFHMPTDAVHFAYMLACQRLGVTYSASAVDSVEDVLTSRAEDLKPKLLIAMNDPVVHGGVEIDCAAKLRRAVPDVPILLAQPWIGGLRRSAEKYATMSDERAFVAIAKLAPPLPCASDHPLFVSYTSGSTGKPKADTSPACWRPW
jgi:acyl-coenzyme A synthetase/AMP-(fatty) acid ligase